MKWEKQPYIVKIKCSIKHSSDSESAFFRENCHSEPPNLILILMYQKHDTAMIIMCLNHLAQI